MSQTEEQRRERIIRHIVALLKKGRDDTPEGETARMFAKKLMLNHNIEVVLKDEDDTPTEKPRQETRAVETEVKPQWWRLLLLQPLAKTYDCTAYATSGEDKRLWLLWLSGKSDQIAKCAVHYEFIVNQIGSMAALVGAEMSRERMIRRRYKRAELEEGVSVGLLQRVLEGLGLGVDAPTSGGGVAFTMELRREPEPQNRTALVPVNRPERVDYEEEVAEDDKQVHLPTVVLDPPQMAIEAGRRRGTFIRTKPPAICFGTVDQLPMDRRAVRALQAAGIRSVYELMRKRPQQLRSLPGIGRHLLSEIYKGLSVHGLSLRQDW